MAVIRAQETSMFQNYITFNFPGKTSSGMLIVGT